MKSRSILIIIFSMMLFIACNAQLNIEQELCKLKSEPIIIPKDMQVNIAGRDTTACDYLNSNLKLVIYSDSLECRSCTINKLYQWNNLIKYAEKFNGDLRYYFIFSTSDEENLKFELKMSLFEYPTLIDYKNNFSILNPHLPTNRSLHTFLLDENNNVVLVGNPLHNPKIEKMFKEIVEEKLGKKE